MKTSEQVQKEIQSINERLLTTPQTEKKLMKRLNAELAFLQQIKWYLDSKPNEQTLKTQLSDLLVKIEKINGSFEKWCNTGLQDKGAKNLLGKYNTEMNVPHIQAQIRTLEYILCI